MRCIQYLKLLRCRRHAKENVVALSNCQAIRAVIVGPDQCEGLGHKVRAASDAKRKWLEPRWFAFPSWHLYRGDVLASRVRSISEAALQCSKP